MPGTDAVKFPFANPFIDDGGQLLAGPVHHVVPQLARFLGFAVNDPLDDEVMQRGVLVKHFQKQKDASSDPLANGRLFGKGLCLTFPQLGAGLQHRSDQKLGLVAEIIPDKGGIDPGRARCPTA